MQGALEVEKRPASRLKKRHVQRETRLPTKRMATACWAFIVAKRPSVETASLLGFCDVARLQHGNSSTSYAQDVCIGCEQVRSMWESAGTPRQPSDFCPN